MKDLFSIIKIGTIPLVFTYLIGAMGYWEVDPSGWGEIGRIILATLFVVWWVVAVGYWMKERESRY